MENASFSLLELFRLGGVIMWPLLLFSIATVAISAERAVFIFYHNLEITDLFEKAKSFVMNNDYSGACEYFSGLTDRRMGARIFLAVCCHVNQGQPFSQLRAERAAETEASGCINSLENGVNFLTALGSLSPLTGFLGTVTGMIGAFRSIAEASEVNAQIVANGIYEALITTVFGLIIAIIAMISHSIITHIIDKFASNIEGTCSELISLIDLQQSVPVHVSESKKKQISKKNEN
ncbi:MAG: MotA/TolQ/ExbB proton channel family protein [Treponema sp.]|nr:MotA/TolQ/ExbB proton channel family protein [Treponema sp.]